MAGDPVAMNLLAGMIEEGHCVVDEQEATAADWYRKAAEAGVVQAQSNFGLMLMKGKGAPRTSAPSTGARPGNIRRRALLDSHKCAAETKAGIELADGTTTYETVGDVARGDHLEHFHSYRREGDTGSDEAAAPAVDHHVDQGLFIAFTPSLTVGEDAPGGVFSVELRDGSVADVDLDGCDDCVYFMLGDGVDQYVNDAALGLRAAPHALTMFDGLDRSWYGLMVLPPRDALSPLHGGAATFGEVRDRLRLGGAGDRRSSAAPRRGDDRYANCTDIFRQPSDGAQHGDYYPQCTSYTHEATAFPSIAPWRGDWRRPAMDVAAAAEAFDGTVDLVYGGRAWKQSYFVPKTVGSLSWTVAGDAVTFKQVVDGRVGWMAVGLENPGGKHNGMNGASIVMAIPDAATAGLEEVDTYVIGQSSSSFRNWYDSSSGAALRDAALDVAEGACYTAATYTLGSVFHANETVDPTKCVDLIWATSKDSNVASDPLFKARGMHEYRGKISVNLTHPAGACYEPPAPGLTAAGGRADGRALRRAAAAAASSSPSSPLRSARLPPRRRRRRLRVGAAWTATDAAPAKVDKPCWRHRTGAGTASEDRTLAAGYGPSKAALQPSACGYGSPHSAPRSRGGGCRRRAWSPVAVLCRRSRR
ncbi:hypothetical protein JL721_13146 [Aureococcus anophagefferens]|nr:hypothetical protein JL721_13146 [Aureococcus anophagefferens]